MASMKREAIREFFRRLNDANPNPQTELEYASPYQLLVAVVLSAQATDRSVNIATRKLFADAPTPEAMVTLGEEGIAEHIKTIGLFRNKAKNTLALSRLLLERHGGEVPAQREALEALPGVGRKTANVVLNTVFRQRGYRKDMGVRGAVAVLFNRRFIKSKKAATSNWANARLTEAQLVYAANDAWAALRVFNALQIPAADRTAQPPNETLPK